MIVVKIGGDGNNGFCNRLPQVRLGIRLELGQDHGGNLLGHEGFLLAVDLTLDNGGFVLSFHHLEGEIGNLILNFGKLPAYEPLGRENGVRGVGNRLALGRLTNQPLAVLAECNDGGGSPHAFGIGNYLGFTRFHNRHARIARAEIYTNYFTHALTHATPAPFPCIYTRY